MSLFRQYGMKRVTEEDLIARAEQHKWRNNPWTFLYRRRQRLLFIWGCVLMLAALLFLVFYPWAIILSGRFGK